MISDEVIRQMRLRIEDECPPGIEDVKNWADALEPAMQEPVAFLFGGPNGDQYCANHWPPQNPGKGKINPLYALPPDAAGEIARLHSDLETAERALDAQTDFRKEIERLMEGIGTAYGYLWHANDEPGTPNRYGSERAAIEARKVLREILTVEQRGKGINAARAAIVGADMNEGK
jgi:hypothetical protein